MRCAIYARISTNDRTQNLEVQLGPLREFVEKRGWEMDGEYVDQESGLKDKRPSFEAVMSLARKRKVDVIAVAALDRWSRSLKSLIDTLNELRILGVSFVSLRESIDLTTPTGELMFHIVGAFSQFEASLIRERVKAGLVLARNRGIRLGRPSIDVDVDEILNLRDQNYSIRRIAKQMNISPTTVFKTLKKVNAKTFNFQGSESKVSGVFKRDDF